MKKVILAILIVSIFGCSQNKNDVEDSLPMNAGYVYDYNNKEKINGLCERILQKGDTIAFAELETIYVISEHSEELLFISSVMAEKYNYWRAYHMNYDILYYHPDKTPNRRRFAFYNLIKAYELGDKQAGRKLKEVFPEGIPKSDKYWK
jgi:hypothetical protein